MVAALALPEVGAVLGDYRLVAQLGAGGMSVVFAAESVHSSRIRRAIKVIHPSLSSDPNARRRFISELECLDVLRRPPHPNILVADDVREIGGQLVMVMELLDGRTLQSLVDGWGNRAPLSEIGDYMLQALDGLAHAHRQGIVHRDLKPSNLFVTQEGQIKILDFGIARAHSGTSITKTDSLPPGTLEYYAPEFAHGSPSSETSDIYSLGITLFQLVTGALPFRAGGTSAFEQQMSLVHQHMNAPLPDTRSLRPDVPEPLIATIKRATEKDPARRYASATAFRNALVACLRSTVKMDVAAAAALMESSVQAPGPAAGGTLRAPATLSLSAPPEPGAPPLQRPLAPGPVETAKPSPRRHAGLWLALAVAVVGAAGGGLFLFTRGQRGAADERAPGTGPGSVISTERAAPVPAPPRPEQPRAEAAPPVVTGTAATAEAVEATSAVAKAPPPDPPERRQASKQTPIGAPRTPPELREAESALARRDGPLAARLARPLMDSPAHKQRARRILTSAYCMQRNAEAAADLYALAAPADRRGLQSFCAGYGIKVGVVVQR